MRSGSHAGAAEVFASSRAIRSPSGKASFSRKFFAGAPFRAYCSRVGFRSSKIFFVINPSSSATTATVSPNGNDAALPRLPGQFAEPKRGFDFRQFWHSLVERIWIVALCVLAGLFLALGYLARTPKLYQGHTVLEVEFQEPRVVPAEESASRMGSMFLASQEAMRTIEQNLTNETLLARVIRSEGLAEDGGRALLGQNITGRDAAKATPRPLASPIQNKMDNASGVTTFTPLEEALGRAIKGMVTPVIRRGTRLIDVYVTNRDPAMAQRLTEAIGRDYIRNSIERRASFNQDALRYLLEEEERLKVNLQKSEAAVAEYKAKTPDALQLGGGTVATGSQTGSGAGAGGARGGVVEDKLQELNTKLTTAKADQIRLEGELQQIEQAGENIDALLAVPSISSSALVNESRQSVTQVEAEIATLALRYKEKHPRMMAARAALAAIILGCFSLYRKAKVAISASTCVTLCRDSFTNAEDEILGTASKASIFSPACSICWSSPSRRIWSALAAVNLVLSSCSLSSTTPPRAPPAPAPDPVCEPVATVPPPSCKASGVFALYSATAASLFWRLTFSRSSSSSK